ncbi:hypothetical protein SASPL_101258 [Salvia splendens]|uniref:Chromo domain-containing protein n=1 Tax=Salvia splendens TaxID=180675 RepID=A0A8X9ABR5_SALSN|nr:hypothetical protein SASPL_101258 [Salvia splendens]
MTASANKKRRDVEFAAGDMVYVRFRPHRQSTLFSSRNRKMAPRFFGPFRIESRIGATAYRLQLPESTRIHPVFHVSLLKRAVGDAAAEADLPEGLGGNDPPFLPEKVLDTRTDHREGEDHSQVLIKWQGMNDDDSTWMDVADVQGQFPFFSLADKAVSTGGAVDTAGAWRVYRRGNRGVVWPAEKSEEAGEKNKEASAADTACGGK